MIEYTLEAMLGGEYMQYSEFYERIYNIKDLDTIFLSVCSDYNLGSYLGYTHIEIGYEDFNIILETASGKYFIKIFNKDRPDSECYRLLKILSCANENELRVPKIFRVNDEALYRIKYENKELRLCVMEFIDGINMYNLSRDLLEDEIKDVARQLAKLDKIDYGVEEYYDEWTITNFENEYNKKAAYLQESDKDKIIEIHNLLKKTNFDALPKAYIHADVIKSNLILAKTGDIYIIDFSVLNYLPRIIELIVAFILCLRKDRKDSIKNINILLNEYNKINHITQEEVQLIPIAFDTFSAMNILQTSFIKATSETFKENEYWLSQGRMGLELKLTCEDIKIKED
jgi:Ser/Thr protein kinase RdoA (MazF antagonist)